VNLYSLYVVETLRRTGELAKVTAADIARGAWQPVLVLGVILLLGRKAFFRNAANRRFTLACVVLGLAMTVNRILAAFQGRAASQIMTSDILLMAAGCGIIGVLMMRWMSWAALIAAAAAVASVAWPDFAGHLAVLAMNVPLVAMLVIWRR
jgi:hypothetical protein